jgi:alcohol dehydrogenase class IV
VTVPRFEFAAAGRIIFGAGALQEAAPIAAGLGRRALVVTGRTSERAAGLLEQLRAHGLAVTTFAVAGEPTTAVAEAGAQQAREAGADLVVGVGGGSVLDAGKAIAALTTNEGAVLDYLEVIGRGRPLQQPPLPYLALPTTAGTGSEVTRNAVLAAPEHQVKVSLRSPLMLPRVAIVDPELTYSVPPAVTATTGLDALAQLLEPFVSHKANPLSDAFCREGLPRAARALPRVYRNGRDPAARAEMALASLCGGLALANAGLGAVHGFAGPIGGMFDAAHGAICASLLPHVTTANIRALQERAPGHPALARYEEAARLLTGDPAATAGDAVSWLAALCRQLDVPPLSAFGIESEQFDAMVAQARQASSMKGNPLPLTDEELAQILADAL